MKINSILSLTLSFAILLLSACVQSENSSSVTREENYYGFDESLYKIETDTDTEEPEFSCDNLPDPVIINANFEVYANDNGSFTVSTNLPDETELSLKLKGRGYLAQGDAFVKGGIAVSDCFTNHGEPLLGDYTLEVSMPIATVQNDYVKHFIGNNGEFLTGPYIKAALGSVMVSKEFHVSFPHDAGLVYTDSLAPVQQAYYKSPNGKKYHTDPDCSGKNSYEITDISELSPCSKCAE